MKKKFNEGNQIHNLISSSGSGTVINYGSGSDFLTSYGSRSGSTSQKVTVPTVPVPVPQHCPTLHYTLTNRTFINPPRLVNTKVECQLVYVVWLTGKCSEYTWADPREPPVWSWAAPRRSAWSPGSWACRRLPPPRSAGQTAAKASRPDHTTGMF